MNDRIQGMKQLIEICEKNGINVRDFLLYQIFWSLVTLDCDISNGINLGTTDIDAFVR